MNKKPLSNTLKLCYGMSFFGSSWIRYFTIYLQSFFFTEIAKVSLGTYTTMTTIASIVGAVLSTFSGVMITKGKPGKWGKTRKWLVIGTLAYVVIYFLCYVRIGTPAVANMINLFGMCCSGTFLTLVISAGGSLSGVISNNQQERALLSSRMSLFSKIGGMAYSMAGATILAFCIKLAGGSQTTGYALAALCAGLIYFLVSFVDFINTKGYDMTDADYKAANIDTTTQSTVKASSPSFKDMGIALVTNPSYFLVVLVNMFGSVAQMFVSSMLIYYYNFVAENAALYTLHLTIANASSLIMALAAPYVTKFLGSTKRTMLLGYSMMTVALLLGKFFGMTPMVFLVCASVFECGMALKGAVSTAMINDCAVYSEWKTGKDIRGILASVNMTFSGTLASTLKNFVFAAAMVTSGYISGEAVTPAIKEGLLNSTTLYPFVLCAIAVVLMVFYKLDKNQIDSMEKEIAERGKTVS